MGLADQSKGGNTLLTKGEARSGFCKRKGTKRGFCNHRALCPGTQLMPARTLVKEKQVFLIKDEQ